MWWRGSSQARNRSRQSIHHNSLSGPLICRYASPMANPEHLAKLKEGFDAWNEWRNASPGVSVDLEKAHLAGGDLILRLTNLSHAKLGYANLTGANLSAGILAGADLHFANLSETLLRRALLIGAIMAGANLAGSDLSEANLIQTDLTLAKLGGANLTTAELEGATLRGADLSNADLTGANLTRANLDGADLQGATLRQAHLFSSNLSGANLTGADLVGADLTNATLREAVLVQAALRYTIFLNADLAAANLSETDMRSADFRSANLQRATLDFAIASDVRLWESQRAGWSAKRIVCACAFWDENAVEPTMYAPGEFERLYSDQTCIELFYQGGVSTFELNTLPALLQYLASLHSDTSFRLKSIEETAGGARISISIGDADTETSERIKVDAMRVVQSQLALRDNEILRLQIQKEYLESFVSEKLMRAILTAGSPQGNVFVGPVYQPMLTAGDSHIHQTINDNSTVLALLENIMNRSAELGLATGDAAKLETQLQSATAELQKTSPDKSVLSRSIGFIQMLATEAVKGAVGKIGESAVADWQVWLHQLGQLVGHLK
jgi:uncharacterized protein YjbI with pentapeptide repeats